MITFKKCKVGTWPTDKATNESFSLKLNDIKLYRNDRKIMGNKIFEVGWQSSHLAYRPQHLYILSNEDIKVGDYFFHTIGGIFKCTGRENWSIQFDDILIQNSYPESAMDQYISKIIATTNPNISLPRISESFIDEFIFEYNQSNHIKEAMVQYHEVFDKQGNFESEFLKVEIIM